ncbi:MULTISPECIES: hypothetical protein [unclassified Anabaena]|uniref:hypothetical protein n=1 Tax=unclassified Anabaena TaxID=2619674 RepID=UPI0039C60C2C
MFFAKRNFKLNFLSLSGLSLANFTGYLSQKQQITHDYSQLVPGRDYVFELINEGTEGQMTGVGKGIKPLDYIILQHGSESYRYQVEAIDYYLDPPDMWMALLKPLLSKSI